MQKILSRTLVMDNKHEYCTCATHAVNYVNIKCLISILPAYIQSKQGPLKMFKMKNCVNFRYIRP